MSAIYQQVQDHEQRWLASAPPHWEVKRLRHAAEINPPTPVSTEEVEVSFVPMEAVGEFGGLDLSRSRPRSEVRSGYTGFVDGDVVVAKITPCFENGKGALADELINATGYGTTELHVLRARAGIDPKYLFYITISHPFRHSGEGAMYGAGGQKRVSTEFVEEFRCAFPPLDEQRAIADFLDDKTAAIDEMISDKRRMLDHLAEQRQTIVDELVLARGLADIPTMESEVPGIGHIPAHWRVVRLKFLGDVKTGITKGRTPSDAKLSDVPYLRVANVQDGYLDLEDVATIPATRQEIERFALRRGDLLMNEGGDNDKLGRGTVWEGQISVCLHQNHVFAVRPRPGIDPYWIDLVAQTSYMRHFFLGRANQSTNLASISATNLKEAPIVMPPPAEREAIIKAVHCRRSALDELVALLTTQIGNLHEYRRSLISEAVTGKLPVREEAFA
jgi:type I restriction enzyme S subunit